MCLPNDVEPSAHWSRNRPCEYDECPAPGVFVISGKTSVGVPASVQTCCPHVQLWDSIPFLSTLLLLPLLLLLNLYSTVSETAIIHLRHQPTGEAAAATPPVGAAECTACLNSQWQLDSASS